MMHYTHITFGLLLSLLYIEMFNVESRLFFVFIALFFSLFPDIDEAGSRIGRKSWLASKAISFIFGHRGFFHTIWIPALLFLILILFNAKIIIGIAVLIGCLSHLFLDALTPAGIRPFYPLHNKRVNGFIKTNSIFEKVFFLAVVFLDIYLVFW